MSGLLSLLTDKPLAKYVNTLTEKLKEYYACYGEIPTNEVLESRKNKYLQSKPR